MAELKIGSAVNVLAGPFAGCKGILLRVKDGRRAVVSLGIIMRSVAVELDLEDLLVRPTQAPFAPTPSSQSLLGRASAPVQRVDVQTMADLLFRAVPASLRDSVRGDLEEEYSTLILPERGARKARAWYFREAVGAVVPIVLARFRRAVRRAAFPKASA